MADIKMVDLHSQYLRIKVEIDRAIQNVLESTAFIQGPEVSAFGEALRRYVGAEVVVPCANGTDALQIAMMALGLRPGDEVILPVHTYVATAEVIALLGLKPVFIDVDSRTFNIDVKELKNKITPATKAIVPVHLYGQCAHMEAVLEVARQNHLYIIEDAAQALGAVYEFSDGTRKYAGTMGTVGTTSFFPSKNLGCYGDGGAIFTNDAELGERIRMIANHGQRTKYKHDIVGVNSRLDTLQAAILNVKLTYLNEYAERRNQAAALYDRNLKETSGITTPSRSANSTHVFHQYTVKAERRDELKDHLARNGVPTMIYYPVPLHFQPAYKQAQSGPGSFPVTEELSKTVLSLPIHTEMNNDQIEFICAAIKNFYQ
jgi:UDP-2-acetamido-2-deoxy-ribo-hexuluronate aminotransferase